MRNEFLFGGTYSSGEQRQYTLSRGHVNGLLVFASSENIDTRLSVKRRVGSQTLSLVPNVRVADLRRISSLESGYDFRSDAWFQLKTLLIAKAVITAGEWTTNMESNGSTSANTVAVAYVPLGSLYLGSDSELDIQLNVSPSLGGSANFRVYAVSRDRVPDFNYVTDYSLNREQMHRNVDSIFLVSADLSVPWVRHQTTAVDLQVLVQDDERETISDYLGHVAMTNVCSEVEGRVVGDILTVYTKRDSVPTDVFLKVTGNDATLFTPLIRKVQYSQQATSANTVTELANLAARVAKLEATDPATAKALRHAGEIGKAADLAAAAQAAAASNAVEKA